MAILEITPPDLLDANVTIIAGILVLLTISVAYRKDFTSKFWGDPILYIGFLPIFFVASISFLLDANPSLENSELNYQISIGMFQLGLSQLMVTVILITALVAHKKKKRDGQQNS